MAKRDSFLLRIDPKILAAIRSWAEDEMRSANGHIEFLLRQSLKNSGRLDNGSHSSSVASDESSKNESTKQDSDREDLS